MSCLRTVGGAPTVVLGVRHAPNRFLNRTSGENPPLDVLGGGGFEVDEE